MSQNASTIRPWWALPVLAAGLPCLVGVAWLAAQYFAALARGAPPSIALPASIAHLPFLISGLPLQMIGAVAAVRPWSQRRSGLPLAVHTLVKEG